MRRHFRNYNSMTILRLLKRMGGKDYKADLLEGEEYSIDSGHYRLYH